MVRLGDIADHLGIPLAPGDRDRPVAGVAPLAAAGTEQLSFLSNPRYRDAAAATGAGAVLVAERHAELLPAGCIRLITPDPYGALADVLALLHPAPACRPGIHGTAQIHPGAAVDPAAQIDAFAVIDEGATIGPGTIVGAHAYIGQGAALGRDGRLYPGVTVYHGCRIGDRFIAHAGVVVGSDGFGFAPGPAGLKKVPQVGTVVIGDDVELGANTTVDRGALGDTVIGDGVKLDNTVQVGHNVTIGAHTVIAAQTGIAGSTAVGGRCMIGGQVAVAGHLTIGDDCMIAGRTGIMRDLAAGSKVAGTPAKPRQRWLRELAAIDRLPDLLRRLKNQDTP